MMIRIDPDVYVASDQITWVGRPSMANGTYWFRVELRNKDGYIYRPDDPQQMELFKGICSALGLTFEGLDL